MLNERAINAEFQFWTVLPSRFSSTLLSQYWWIVDRQSCMQFVGIRFGFFKPSSYLQIELGTSQPERHQNRHIDNYRIAVGLMDIGYISKYQVFYDPLTHIVKNISKCVRSVMGSMPFIWCAPNTIYRIDSYLPCLQISFRLQSSVVNTQLPIGIHLFLGLHRTPLLLPCQQLTRGKYCRPNHKNHFGGAIAKTTIIGVSLAELLQKRLSDEISLAAILQTKIIYRQFGGDIAN